MDFVFKFCQFVARRKKVELPTLMVKGLPYLLLCPVDFAQFEATFVTSIKLLLHPRTRVSTLTGPAIFYHSWFIGKLDLCKCVLSTNYGNLMAWLCVSFPTSMLNIISITLSTHRPRCAVCVLKNVYKRPVFHLSLISSWPIFSRGQYLGWMRGLT